MKILIHNCSENLIEIHSNNDKSISVNNLNYISALWEIAERFPEELIIWCDERIFDKLNIDGIEKEFHHDLLMVSYSCYSEYLPPAIGYIDQMPFVHVNYNVRFGTWRMSTDVGGIKGKTLTKFKDLFEKETNLGFLLNSIAKIGLENGLFCYSSPNLVLNPEVAKKREIKGDISNLFRFVYSHYSTIWTSILFWCFIRKEKKVPVISFFSAYFHNKFFRKVIELRDITIESTIREDTTDRIDVIIPTIGRKEELKQVMYDLRMQTLTPYQVLIIEQKPEQDSTSDLNDLIREDWPFKVIHIFTNRIGVCNARNLGLEKVVSDWVFLCDDDNRIPVDVLRKSLAEIRRLGVNMINTAYRQPDESIIFRKIKQWGTFGAGNSIVKREFITGLSFSKTFEHGYGEDKDFGMQLRNNGCDIIYNPFIEIIHLKAPIGGFRVKKSFEWESALPKPKPSPTVMAYILKYFTVEQVYGYKVSMFLKYYSNQKTKNPLVYLSLMNKSWKNSVYWATQLLDNTSKRNLLNIPENEISPK